MVSKLSPKSVSPQCFSLSTSFLRFSTSWTVMSRSDPEIIRIFFKYCRAKHDSCSVMSLIAFTVCEHENILRSDKWLGLHQLIWPVRTYEVCFLQLLHGKHFFLSASQSHTDAKSYLNLKQSISSLRHIPVRSRLSFLAASSSLVSLRMSWWAIASLLDASSRSRSSRWRSFLSRETSSLWAWCDRIKRGHLERYEVLQKRRPLVTTGDVREPTCCCKRHAFWGWGSSSLQAWKGEGNLVLALYACAHLGKETSGRRRTHADTWHASPSMPSNPQILDRHIHGRVTGTSPRRRVHADIRCHSEPVLHSIITSVLVA